MISINGEVSGNYWNFRIIWDSLFEKVAYCTIGMIISDRRIVHSIAFLLLFFSCMPDGRRTPLWAGCWINNGLIVVVSSILHLPIYHSKMPFACIKVLYMPVLKQPITFKINRFSASYPLPYYIIYLVALKYLFLLWIYFLSYWYISTTWSFLSSCNWLKIIIYIFLNID